MIINTINEVIQSKYNQGVFCSEYSKNEDLDVACKLGAVSPVEIIDKNSFTHIKFIKFLEVGKITLSGEGKIKYATDPEKIHERISSELIDLRSRTENIILSSIYDKLIKIAMIRTSLNPIYAILKDVYNKEIKYLSIKNYPKKYETYFKFLCNINMIRASKTGYVEGNNFIQIRNHLSKEDDELVLNKVFGQTINEGKYYLIDNLRLYILKPFIRLSTSFYTSSIQLRENVSITKKVLFNKYVSQYDLNTSYSKFEGFLDQLSRAEIIEEKKDTICVMTEIMNRINQNLKQDKELLTIYC